MSTGSDLYKPQLFFVSVLQTMNVLRTISKHKRLLSSFAKLIEDTNWKMA
jgi:hypothetical protein